jgi:hypothetical protein
MNIFLKWVKMQQELTREGVSIAINVDGFDRKSLYMSLIRRLGAGIVPLPLLMSMHHCELAICEMFP